MIEHQVIGKHPATGVFLAHPHQPPNAPAFAEVMLQQPSHDPSAGLRIVLPCGTVIEIHSRSALPLAAELITTLRRPC